MKLLKYITSPLVELVGDDDLVEKIEALLNIASEYSLHEVSDTARRVYTLNNINVTVITYLDHNYETIGESIVSVTIDEPEGRRQLTKSSWEDWYFRIKSKHSRN